MGISAGVHGCRRCKRYLTTYTPPVIVPPDGTIINITNVFSMWITGIYYLWSSLGVALTVAFGVFNFLFRVRKSVIDIHVMVTIELYHVFHFCRVIKLTSPNLNYFLLTGVFINFAATYVRLYPDISEHYATIRCSVSGRCQYAIPHIRVLYCHGPL